MPDRKSEIVELFVRDLDQIELPPHDLWRPAPRKESYLMKTSRYVLYAGAVAAVLAVALLVGLGLRDRNVQVAATPSPIAATSTPIPASSAPATPSAVATASPSPSARPVGFVLPAGCSFVGTPVVGSDYSRWQFDCGATANRDARGTLAPAFAQQAWIGCGVGLGSATWMKGDMRLVVSEGSGVPGPSGLPTLTQPARTVQTACG